MLQSLARYWWVIVLRGVVALLFGLMALVWPGLTLLVLVALFGAYALVDGLFTLGSAFGDRAAGSRGWMIARGLAGVLAGLLTLLWPGMTALVLLVLIGVWALVAGVLEIVAAVQLRREIDDEWLLALSGVLSVVFGIVLLIWPVSGALAVAFVIGVYAIVCGIILIMLGVRLRRLSRAPADAAEREPAG